MSGDCDPETVGRGSQHWAAAIAEAVRTLTQERDALKTMCDAAYSEAQLRVELEITQAENAREAAESTIMAVVHTIGGTVEGAPTHRGNFLQRVRELVDAERPPAPDVQANGYWVLRLDAKGGQGPTQTLRHPDDDGMPVTSDGTEGPDLRGACKCEANYSGLNSQAAGYQRCSKCSQVTCETCGSVSDHWTEFARSALQVEEPAND